MIARSSSCGGGRDTRLLVGLFIERTRPGQREAPKMQAIKQAAAARELKRTRRKPNPATRPSWAAIDRQRLISLLLVTICYCCCSSFVCQAQQQQQQQPAQEEPAAKQTQLPTVIVRGFLNYRTTVDGTVLLFTPDAGQQQQQQQQQPASTTAGLAPTATQPAAEWTPASESLEPPQLAPTSTGLVEQEHTLASAVGQPAAGAQQADAGAADLWQPIQATPPLRSAQSTFQPSAIRQRTDATISAADSTAAAAAIRPAQTDGEQRPAPTARARRPALGFHGRQSQPRGQSANQAAAQASNSINGIRRPGLPMAAAAAAASDSADANSAVSGAFQARLQSAKLRNKFRRPGSSAMASSSSAASNSASGGGGGSPNAAVADPAPSAGLDQASSEVQPPPPQQQQQQSPPQAHTLVAVAAELQPRPAASDIFNPGAASPAVGSDEILELPAPPPPDRLESRLGEQRPRPEAQLISGGLTGSVDKSGPPLTFDAFFQNDQPPPSSPSSSPGDSSQASEHKPNHLAPRKKTTSINNDKFHGRLDQHHHQQQPQQQPHHHHHHGIGQGGNKFAPRPPPSSSQPSNSSLAASASAALAPSFASNIPPMPPTQASPAAAAAAASSSSQAAAAAASGEPAATQANGSKPAVGSLDEQQPQSEAAAASSKLETNSSSSGSLLNGGGEIGAPDGVLQLQTITRTYSTVMTSLKTRLVPLQVKSSTAIHTLTESYVITKLMTAYQTLPAGGEFILPEPTLSTRAPFEMFNEPSSSSAQDGSQVESKAAAAAAVPAPAPVFSQPAQEAAAAAGSQQEQPIQLNEAAPKSANDWLHDFTNTNSNSNPFASAQPNSQGGANTNLGLAALLEQQAQEANLAGLAGLPMLAGGEPLDQLASTTTLDPAALLADGTINIPDLNNPLVLAAAIQNPQLAAVILAAQQLRLRQQRAKLHNHGQGQQQQHLMPSHQLQLQPSYSTSLSTSIKPTTYTVRDTMYTTRLVSFRDGRTVRTRTVSEPGSVIEQVLTTMATEVTPVTLTIRPTGVLAGGLQAATAAASNSNQATINNALFATQLAGLLARRQQQVQPSSPAAAAAASSSPQSQLALLQQLLAGNQQSPIQQQQQQQAAAASRQQQQQQQQQFQPNLQQLLQSMQPSSASPSQQPSSPAAGNKPAQAQSASAQDPKVDPQQQQLQLQQQSNAAATPPLPQLPTQPIVTTLTNLQVRTYTVHNAFKTIYRTITSTQLVTSTILPAGVARNTQLPLIG